MCSADEDNATDRQTTLHSYSISMAGETTMEHDDAILAALPAAPFRCWAAAVAGYQ